MSCTRTKNRDITMKEFKKEKEHPYKWFILKYHEWGNIITQTKVFQRKEDVQRYLDNPLTQDVSLQVREWIDDG